jgi:hypothetical protein
VATTSAAIAPATGPPSRRPTSQQSGSAASAKTTESQRSAYGDESKASAMCEKTKWSGPPPRSHMTVSITSPSGRAAIRPLTASSSKSGLP